MSELRDRIAAATLQVFRADDSEGLTPESLSVDPDDVFDPRLFKCLECRPQIVITNRRVHDRWHKMNEGQSR